MPIREIFLQTLQALWETKLRSFLTMFGIVWGITSVILLVGLGIGFSKDQHERMKGLGVDIAIIWGGKTGAQAGGYVAGRNIRLDIGDAIAIRDQAALVQHVSPEIMRSVNEVSQYNASNRPVRGVWPEYQAFRSIKVSEGRLMTQRDEDDGARVVLLGDDAKQQLFRSNPAVGQTISIAGYPYTVIGILEKKKQNGSYGSGRDGTQLFVPYASMARDFPPTDRKGIFPGWINNLVVQPVSPEKHEAAVKEVYRILGERHHFNPDDEESLWVWDTLQGARFVDRIFRVMTIFLGAVALLTLALGGIGVMNIMLVAVTERTREIGVRKALGARAADIHRQFLAESAIITLVSGSIGFLLGAGACVLIRNIPMPDFVPHPVISPVAIVLSLLTLTAITLFAGTYPARRASNLSPMECLRTD